MATIAPSPSRALTPFDPSDATLYSEACWAEPFAAARRDMPVSYRAHSPYGPYWSIVTHDLIQQAEIDADTFSSASERGGITITDAVGDREFPNFIAMDRPGHTEQRKVVAPAFSPSEMARREIDVRTRATEIFDGLPIGEAFDWVERVSIELTIGMLAILFDFPRSEQADLKRWSDMASNVTPDRSEEQRVAFFGEMSLMLARFDALFEAKRAVPPTGDLLSLMIHSKAMGDLSPLERVANIALLIVGGNDTTRNSMSGFVAACAGFPEQLEILRADRSLIPNAAQEIIRWQSPVTHMRRTATRDTVLGGQPIAAGDKVILWYVSGNRDEAVFAEADQFDVTRANARRHVAFGHGPHRCVGARLAEIQLAVMIEEILDRRLIITPVGEPERMVSCFLNGYTRMPVVITQE